MKTKLALLFSIIFFGFMPIKDMKEIRSFSVRNIGTIRDGNDVKGYYMFYEVDKADRKNRNFKIDLFDENVKVVKSIPFTKPKDTYLITSEFNGDAIVFMYYEEKGKVVEIDSYDLDGNKLGSYISAKVDKMEEYTYASIVKSENEESRLMPTLFSAGKYGFIRTYFKKKNKYGYEVEMLDNHMRKMWTIGSDEKSDKVESAAVSNIDGKYAALAVTKRKSMMTTTGDNYLLVLNLETGKSEFEMPIEDKQYSVSVTTVTYDTDNNDILLMGDYYPKTEQPGKGKSTGFYVKHLDLKGKEKSKRYISWTKDVGKFLSVNDKGKLEDNFLVFFHCRYRMADGNTYVIGETYKKKANGLGIAMSVLNHRDEGVANCEVGDMLVFKLDTGMNLKDVQLYEKYHSTVGLPAGIDMMGPGLVAAYINYSGQFDYMYGLQSNDKKTFSCVYVNYDKEKGEKPKNCVGSIFLSPAGKLSTDKVDLPIEKNTSYTVLAAKQGYFMLTEYNKKEKSLNQSLVKMNY